jgi:cell division protein FtsW
VSITTIPVQRTSRGREGYRSAGGRPSLRRPVTAEEAGKARTAVSPREHRVLLGSIVGLLIIGLPIVLAASSVNAVLQASSPWGDFARQCIFVVVGITAGTIASRVQPETIRRLRFVLPIGVLALLVVVFLPGLGHYAGGSSRWIGVGPIQLQPSELMKLALIVFGADLLARRARRRDQFQAVVVPLLVLLAVAGMLIMKQPDLGTTIVLCCITFGLLFVANVRLRLLAAVAACVGVAGGAIALRSAYSRARLFSFVNPFAHASGSGYQVVQSLATLGLGGPLGNGIGGTPTTWGYLPNSHTDFVFAVLGGNLGLVGSFAVLTGFAAFAWAGIRIAARERDPFTRFLAVGITVWILSQAIINIGGVLGALPVTGIPLPFVSYGGSALVVAMTGAGILLGIARRQRAAGPLAVQRIASGPRRAGDRERRTPPAR